MIIFKVPFKRGFCFRPFIGIPSRLDRVDWDLKEAYVEHEKAHYKRQGFFPVIWLCKYILSDEFRLQEELEAYRAEIVYLIKRGQDVSVRDYAIALSRNYWGMISYGKAAELLTKIIDEALAEANGGQNATS